MEWGVRFTNLNSIARDSNQQLLGGFDRLSLMLPKNERETLMEARALLQIPRSSLYDGYTALSQQISMLIPSDPKFFAKLEQVEKEITGLKVKYAAELEKLMGSIKRQTDEISYRERSPIEETFEVPVMNPKIVSDTPIGEFQAFIARTGGRTGGWEQRTHAEFINCYNRYGPDGVLEKFTKMPQDKINEHIEWYEKYEELHKKMKNAIAERQQSRRNTNEAPKKPKVDIAAVDARIEERERIKQQRKEEAEREAQLELKREKERKKKRLEEINKQLQARRTARVKPIPADPVETPRRRKTSVSTEEWKRITERNEELIRKKAEDARRRQEEQDRLTNKERRMMEEHHRKIKAMPFDPERHLMPTLSQLAKRKKDDSEPRGPVNSVFDIPHRATPAWMR